MRGNVWLFGMCILALLASGPVALGAEKVAAPVAPAAASEGVATPESLDALVDLLTAKGVLTAEEAASVKQRAAEKVTKEKAEKAAAAAKLVYPTLKIKARLQARWSQVESAAGQPYWGERDDKYGGDGFAIRRARFHLLGALNPDIGYNVILAQDWGATNSLLHLAQMDWNGWREAKIMAGILNVPAGWEIQQNDAEYLPVDISTASLLLPPDKDVGVRIDSKRPLFGALNYQVGIFNGSGRYAANPNHSYMTAARVFVNPSRDLTLGVSASLNPNTDTSSYQTRFLKNNLTATADPYGLLPAYAAKAVDETMVGADLQWRHGADTVLAEWLRMNIDRGSLGSDVDADGYVINYLHALPYHGDPDKAELILGYQKFDPNTSVSDKYDQTAYTLGLNYHIRGSARYTCPAGVSPCGSVLRLNYIWNHEPVSVRNNKWVMQYQTWF